jgi:hypothetical protein
VAPLPPAQLEDVFNWVSTSLTGVLAVELARRADRIDARHPKAKKRCASTPLGDKTASGVYQTSEFFLDFFAGSGGRNVCPG